MLVFASCGGASTAISKDGGGAGASGGAGGDNSGAGGDMTGAGGDMTGAGGGAGGAGGMTGGAGKGGGGGKGGATGGGGKGGATGNKDGGVADDGGTGLAMCKHATTCAAGDPPCLRACGTGRDVTCECGTGALAGKLVCETVCERPDGGGATDGGVPAMCPATIRSGATACTPKTETTCETACAAKLHRECTCVATTGARGVWFCFRATACQ
jgi:hypothetical protein